MSKAEKEAYKAYPYNGDYRGQGDSNSKIREAYINGYHQAEKDLELSWEDVRRIYLIINSTINDIGLDNLTGKSIYQEVLKRFKDYKEK